jgi:dipeptidyl aminopeptidase/acylaminoacyl peptidase
MRCYKYLYLYILYIFFFSKCFILSAMSSPLPEIIPRKVLFGNPVKDNALLSPDGKQLSYLAPVDNVLNIWVKTIGKEDDRPVTDDKNRGIHYYFWAEDNRHILYAQDFGGNENWQLFAVDLETNKIKDLTPFEDIQVSVIETNKNFPNEVIFSMNKENPEVHDMYHLNLKSSELKLIAKNPGSAIDWIIDPHFKVRGAIVAKSDGGFDLMVRDSSDTDWKILISWNAEDGLSSAPNFISPPTFFSKDGKYIYLMDSRGVNAGRFVRIEITTGNIDVVAEDPHYDVSKYILIHPDNYEIQAIAFEKARLEWTILDESIKDDFDVISKLSHGDFVIVSRDSADETWLVSFEKDNGSVSYYIYDRKTKKGMRLFNKRPELDKYTLAEMLPISFTSRDGLTIHGYITYPPGKEKKNLPLVLEVHGGPWARNSWEYDPQAQWLANRGYACLQVNFRGSTGYGKDFLNAGNKEWGGKAQDDLVDGVHWAIKKGIADPERVAIYGSSYGGYAALAGATFTPELFCCAVDICGPSNLITFIEAIPSWYSTLLATIYKRVGNPDMEKEFLKSRSPLFKADQIKIPILIAQGANDPRVKQKESEQIIEVLEKNGIDYEYMLFPDEGHGLRKPENRLKFYATAEKFLAKHLGGRYEEALEESDY